MTLFGVFYVEVQRKKMIRRNSGELLHLSEYIEWLEKLSLYTYINVYTYILYEETCKANKVDEDGKVVGTVE